MNDKCEEIALETPRTVSRQKHGVFPWSNSAPGSFRLSLAHPQVTDTGESNSVNVLCLDLSPTGDFIATGREDGVANVWRYGYVGEFPGSAFILLCLLDLSMNR